MSVEAGGINSTIPIVAAAELELPLLDPDGMGRAFPEIPQCSMSVRGVSATPMALADEKRNLELLETINNDWTERLSRTATVAMGGSSIIALYPMTVEEAASAVIPKTMSRAVQIGWTIRATRSRGENALEALLDLTSGRLLFRGKVADVLRRTVEGFATIYGRGIPLFEGKVVDVERRTREGFAIGHALLQGLGSHEGSHLEVRFQNENLVAIRDGETIASVPDLICLLDSERATGITTERLRYGQRVTAIGIPTPEIMRSEEALKVWGPAAFGYDDLAFHPLERRFAVYYAKHGVPAVQEKYLQPSSRP